MECQASHNHLLILSQHFEIYEQLIRQQDLPGLSILAVRTPEEAMHLGQGCNILFGEPAPVSKVINLLPNIRWVQLTWAGVDPLLVAGMRRDYVLTNARNVYGGMISEYVFGYILMIERRILPRWQAQLKGQWDESPHGHLRGKLIGLLGVGTIGAQLAKTAHHFGMEVFGYTRQSESSPDVDRYFHAEHMRAFAAELDYLVCTLPGTKASQNLVNAQFLAALPDKTWLINVGRGITINEPDLVAALQKGSIAGAILDVFIEEPLPPDNPLWTTPNTFITCHTAARNYPPDIARLFIDNYLRWLQGRSLQYQVDFNLGY